MPKQFSLLEFARRRSRLAGFHILDHSDPWFLQVDEFRSSVEASGKTFLSFAHYDYLGLSDHPEVRNAAQTALETQGTSVSASRLVGGERVMQRQLESDIAAFTRHGDALVLISGYLTNVTILGHLLGKHDLILYDELCHNSIAVGLSASRATSKPFRHNDLDHLRSLLTRTRGQYKRCLLVVESLYSMDGDLVDLPSLVEIKKRHDCWLLVDEAHSIGTVGATGRGICEHFQVDPDDIDLTIGTLSKSLVSSGGYVAAAKPVIRWLRYTLPGFVFSVGISPVATAAAKAALNLLSTEPDRVRRLQKRSEFFLKAAKARGLDTANAIGRGVIPVQVPDNASALLTSEALLQADIYVPPILRIGVPNDKPRLRFFICSFHTNHEIEQALDIISSTLKTSAVSKNIVGSESSG